MAVKNKQEEPFIVAEVPAATYQKGDLMYMLTQEQMWELSRLLGINLKNGDDLVQQCRRVSTINIEGTPITLEPGLLTRLKSRCPSNVAFDDWLRSRVKEWAHAYVGW